MECDCVNKNIKSHDVTRRSIVLGNYNQCGICGRVEWNYLTDQLEQEINDPLYNYLVKPIHMAKEPYL